MSIIKHWIFTRIACDARTINKSEPRPDEHIEKIIRTWIDFSGTVYNTWWKNRQDFRVLLRYSDRYAHLIKKIWWDNWAILTPEFPHENVAALVRDGDFCTMSRVDADDSYSIDFLDHLDRYMKTAPPGKSLLLHKRIRQVNTLDGHKMTEEMVHKCPMFSTIVWKPWVAPDDMRVGERHGPPELLGLIGNHGKFHELPHEELPECVALMRITGINAANQLGLMGREWKEVNYAREWDPRFEADRL